MEQISLHILECYLIKVMTANKHSESILLPHHLQFGITGACMGLHLFIPVQGTGVLILLLSDALSSVYQCTAHFREVCSDLFQLYNVRENRNGRSARRDSGTITSLLPFPSLCHLQSHVLL